MIDVAHRVKRAERCRPISPTDPGDLGRRLVQRRLELGLDRAVVAERAEVDPHYLEYLEYQPGASCSARTLQRLARALATTSAHLLGVGYGQPLGAGPPPGGTPEVEILDQEACLRLIRPGGIGRLVFTDDGRPVALPINFRLLGDGIVFRTGDGSISEAVRRGAPLSLEVDRLDETLGEGWSVVVSGPAVLVGDRDELRQVSGLQIEPWAGQPRPRVVRMALGRVTGRQIHRHL
jgi:hypothetical protein